MQISEEFDDDEERVESTKKSISTGLKSYKELYEQKKLTLPQKRIDSFFKPISSDATFISQSQISQKTSFDDDIKMIIFICLSNFEKSLWSSW